MYVKKFDGETLDEALQAVKRELGPDAIILKTVSNKGLKGAFKKSRIEITAAISEESYGKKSRVDHVLSDEQKENFYQAPASRINNMIDQYDGNRIKSGYGNMGLNKVVNSVSKVSHRLKSSLDDFLALDEETPREKEGSDQHDESHGTNQFSEVLSDRYGREREYDEEVLQQKDLQEFSFQHRENSSSRFQESQTEFSTELQQQLKSQKHQIDLLERKIYELSQKMSEKGTEEPGPRGITGLRTTLRSLELSEQIVQTIIKKANFDLDREQLDDADILYEFALRELNEMIQVAMPLFSSTDIQTSPVVTVLISENSCGQSSMAMKLAVLQENVRVIRFREGKYDLNNTDFTSKIFNLDMVTVQNLSLLMSEARKTVEEGKSVILDLKLDFKDNNETKKFLEMIKRSFKNMEILMNISGIHSELFNRKMITKYKSFSDGIVISFLDQCLSFGSLVNIHLESGRLPFKFFGTGAMVPDDIEAATAERILAGMFQF